MERKFYTDNDNFERLLRENAEQFKMVPSKKVWHGIYNDMHPGRRWPSVAISLLFIFTLVIIGYLNTQQSERSYLAKNEKDFQSQKISKLSNSSHNRSKRGKINNIQKNKPAVDNSVAPDKTFTGQINTIDEIVQVSQPADTKVPENLVPAATNSSLAKETNVENNDRVINSDQTEQIQNLPEISATPIAGLKGDENTVTPVKSSGNYDKNNDVTKITNNGTTDISKNTATVYKAPNKHVNQVQPETSKGAPHVSFLKKMYKSSRINWTYYVSPGVSYRIYSNGKANANVALAGLIYNNTDLSKAVTHSPSPGLEAGTAMKYSLTKRIKLTSGFQANYSTYSVEANNIHPIIATLLLYNDKTAMPYAISSISYYGNGPGAAPIKLHNYTVQVSLPIGLEYKIAGKDNIGLNAAASLQPSLMITNQAYLLSTDKQNYLTEANLSRKWNMGTNIGAFISINSNKLQWQVGPQVNYQLLSTYVSAYHVREHFIDYGIRLGVSILK